MKFLVTGTGRCGLGYVARTLSEFFGQPVGHKAVFTTLGVKEPGEYLGDASWLAAPYLSEVEIPVIQIVRHPLEVVNALAGAKFFAPEDPSNLEYLFAVSTCPGISGVPRVDWEPWFVWMWSELIEPYITMRFRVEEFGAGQAEVIARHITWPLGRDLNRATFFPVEKYQIAKPQDDRKWDDLNEPYRSLLQRKARQYGYVV